MPGIDTPSMHALPEKPNSSQLISNSRSYPHAHITRWSRAAAHNAASILSATAGTEETEEAEPVRKAETFDVRTPHRLLRLNEMARPDKANSPRIRPGAEASQCYFLYSQFCTSHAILPQVLTV